MRRGLYIGRFQPFHKGHFYVIKKILGEVDEVIILIGSADKFNTIHDPLTIDERIEILTEFVQKEKILDKIYIVSLNDINDRVRWVKYVEKNTPRFDVVYSGDDLNHELFTEKGYEAKILDRWKGISASLIRKSIVNGEEWKDYVNKFVYEKLKIFDFENRIKKLNKQSSLK